MLLNSFFNVSGNVLAKGYVVFESNVPGHYTRNFSKKHKFEYFCVAAGSGGSSVYIEFNYGKTYYLGIFAAGGGSGGYSNGKTYALKNLNIQVGDKGLGYASSSTVAVFNPPTPQSWAPPSSNVGANSYINNIWYAEGTTVYYATWVYCEFGHGYGSTRNGDYGSTAQGIKNDANLAGGSSRYGGYGAGGSAGFTGSDQSGTPWANDGTNGYVKIIVTD